MWRKGPNAAAITRGALEPVAARLGLSYDLAFFEAPDTPEARALEALRCGFSLLMPFTYADEWPGQQAVGNVSKKDRSRAARFAQEALVEDEGRSAVAHMACGYGRGLAATWRRAAEDDEYADSVELLREDAERSEELGDYAARVWPPHGGADVIAKVVEAEEGRLCDPDNPDALVDLHGYAMRVRVTAEALALLLAPRFDEFAWAITSPIISFDLEHATGLTANWGYTGAFWSNALSDDPLSRHEVTELQAAGA